MMAGRLDLVRVFLVTAVLLALIGRLGESEAHADTLDTIRARHELTWGADIQGGEPYVFEGKNGELVGFEVSIAERIASHLGVRARCVQAEWSNLVPSLERSDFDVVLNGLEATPERRRRIRLSRPYYEFGETLAVSATSTARSLDDLNGKRVGTLNQTYAFDLLEARPLERVLYEGVQEPYIDLQRGRIDGVLLDSVIANRYGCVLPGVRCLVEPVARSAYVVGLRKDDVALAGEVDAAIAAMIADGSLRQDLQRWGLWNDDQTRLDAPDTSAPPPEPATLRTFDRAQLVLFFEAALATLAITIASFALAVPLGLGLAILRLYFGRTARLLATAYVEIWRGTPVLLQLYLLYYGLAPYVRLGPIVAAVLGLGLNYAAYEAEVYRGALSALPRGQSEAAFSLGLTRAQTLRHVLLPQAVRHALPAVTNDFVALLKDSSLVSVITVVELTKRMTIAAVEVRGWLVPGLLCAALYFAMSFPVARLATRLERRLAS
jgi:polar amino acid transport system substrate-binding protein